MYNGVFGFVINGGNTLGLRLVGIRVVGFMRIIHELIGFMRNCDVYIG